MMQHGRCGSHQIAVKYFVLVNEKPLKNVRDNKKLMVTSRYSGEKRWMANQLK